MKILDTATLTKDIHFPVTRAIYKVAPKRSWLEKVIKFFTYRRWFELYKDYVLWIPCLESYVFIPNTFVYDLASVPKLLNGFFNSNGMLLLGALPHDFGYRYECLLLIDEMTGELYRKSFTKKELDQIFENLCSWESKFYTASKVAEFTLGVVGFFGWKENRKACHVLDVDFPGLFAKESFK